MKERPILFSPPMVRAILEGRKLQTRRIVPDRILNKYYDYDDWCTSVMPRGIPCTREYEKEFFLSRCPYGRLGDRLWIRETFAIEHQVEHDQKPPFNDGRPILAIDDIGWRQPHYKASDPTPELSYEDSDGEPCVRWKPSIHMPRWASRIDLEITGVRVERLQDISEEDAKAEGLEYREEMWGIWNADGSMRCGGSDEPVDAFRCLWININGNGSWDANPWVWVIEFKELRIDNINAERRPI